MELGRLIEKKYAGVHVVYELPAVVPDVICDPGSDHADPDEPDSQRSRSYS